MKRKHTSKYIISLIVLLFGFVSKAQTDTPKDSITKKQAHHIRLGIDISRPIIQLIQEQEVGFELTADYRVTTNWYAAVELGTESEPGVEDLLRFHTKGSYTKIGFNYNTYENWKGMNNEVFIGMRYGYSRFQQELISFQPDQNTYFEPVTMNPNTVYTNLNASWISLHAGIKVEVLKNLFLSSSVQLRKLITQKKPDSFANLYVPGFNKVLLNNKGFGFNYTVSYLIPLNFNKNE